MPDRQRYFTVEEANRLIPKLEQDIAELRDLRKKLETLGAELSPLFKVISHNGGHRKAPEFAQLAEQLHQTVDRLQSRGCYLKGIDIGLLDFPHLRDGREVYLCWKSGEKEIGYWHDIDTGYADRQAL